MTHHRPTHPTPAHHEALTDGWLEGLAVPRPRAAPKRIAFHRPTLVGTETSYVARAIRERELAGGGPFAARCEALLSETLAPSLADRPEVRLTTSSTSALELAAQLLRDGDAPPGEVILPALVSPSTASAFTSHGFRAVLCDVRPEDGTLEPERVAQAIGPRTRALVAVHPLGFPCDVVTLGALARAHGVVMLEDASHALFARVADQPVGTFGELACFSFHAEENVSCGEGGALAIRDSARELGRRWRSDGASAEPSDRVGASRLSELQAAYLFAQLERADRLQARRRTIAERYRLGLGELERAGHLALPTFDPARESNHHAQWVRLADAEERTRLRAHLARRRIDARPYPAPLHRSPAFARTWVPGSLPVAEHFADSVLRLPMHGALGEAEVDRVIEAVRAFFRR